MEFRWSPLTLWNLIQPHKKRTFMNPTLPSSTSSSGSSASSSMWIGPELHNLYASANKESRSSSISHSSVVDCHAHQSGFRSSLGIFTWSRMRNASSKLTGQACGRLQDWRTQLQLFNFSPMTLDEQNCAMWYSLSLLRTSRMSLFSHIFLLSARVSTQNKLPSAASRHESILPASASPDLQVHVIQLRAFPFFVHFAMVWARRTTNKSVDDLQRTQQFVHLFTTELLVWRVNGCVLLLKKVKLTDVRSCALRTFRGPLRSFANVVASHKTTLIFDDTVAILADRCKGRGHPCETSRLSSRWNLSLTVYSSSVMLQLLSSRGPLDQMRWPQSFKYFGRSCEEDIAVSKLLQLTCRWLRMMFAPSWWVAPEARSCSLGNGGIVLSSGFSTGVSTQPRLQFSTAKTRA